MSWANFIDHSGDGLYSQSSTPPPPSGTPGIGRNATAGYFASTVGRLRLEELQAGMIDHALMLVVKCQRSLAAGQGEVVFPSNGNNAFLCDATENTNAPALGARVYFDKSEAAIEQMPISRWKKTILKALSKYGAIISDTGGGWSFEIESSAQQGPGAARRWFDWAWNEMQFGEDWYLWVGPDGAFNTADDVVYGDLDPDKHPDNFRAPRPPRVRDI